VERKKPGVTFWATVVMVVTLVAYPLSFGPACWLCEKGVLSRMDDFPTINLARIARTSARFETL
jgi:hypothetical protein